MGIRWSARSARFAVVAVFAGIYACGGSDGGGNPGGPSGGGASVGSTGSVGTLAATITIANGTVNPGSVTISVGQSVRFVNSDSRSHDMNSDPHPAHTNCPSIGNVANLAAGQTKDTFGFAAAGSCGFHDHNDPDNNGLKGRITIQ